MPANRHSALNMVLAALFCALAAVLAQLQIPLPAVPISLTTLAVYLCGALLPPRFAAFSMLAYALLGAIGVPVFSGFSAGPSVLFGPSGGFIFGYALCAAVISLLLRRLPSTAKCLPLAMAAGTLCCYALGAAWFAAVTGTGFAGSLAACVLPFLPGDALKIALAAQLARRVRSSLHP